MQVKEEDDIRREGARDLVDPEGRSSEEEVEEGVRLFFDGLVGVGATLAGRCLGGLSFTGRGAEGDSCPEL